MKKEESHIAFSKTIVLTDLHGDLNVAAKSLAEYGIVKYEETDFEEFKKAIKQLIATGSSAFIDAMLIKQPTPLRLIFLGDYVDRNDYSYELIQFLQQINREDNNIFCVFLLGNHDLINLTIFTNPVKIYDYYKYSGQDMKSVTEFFDSMKVVKSVKSFVELHKDELIGLQTKFFNDKEIELPLSGYSIKYKYNHDYTHISKFTFDMEAEEQKKFFLAFEEKIGVKFRDYYKYTPDSLLSNIVWYIGEYVSKFEEQNFIMLQPPENDERAYYGDWARANFLSTQIDETKHEVQIIDWRIVCYVWRKHYSYFFKNIKYWFSENDVLYTHAGLSPQTMVDSFTLAPIYDIKSSKIKKELRWNTKKVFASILNRTNKLMTQVISNALADYSFAEAAGTEVFDVIGYSRGYGNAMPDFGSSLWCDYNHIQKHFSKKEYYYEKERPKMIELYTDFGKLTGIKKIICGHTQYVDHEETNVRYRKIKDMEETGLEYICIDNGCSEIYRRRKGSVVNGVELDKDTNIITPTDSLKDEHDY